MSPHLPGVRGSDLVREWRRAGWHEIRQESSHVILGHTDSSKLLVVPVHKGQDVKQGILADILKDTGLTPSDLRRLL